MKKIMKRAWEIYRTLIGDHIAKLALALRQAWAEAKAAAKNAAKKAFGGFAKVAKIDDPYDDCCFFSFKRWEKYGKKRIYINDYKGRTIGYIDIENGEFTLKDRQGNFQTAIDYALESFRSTYAF